MAHHELTDEEFEERFKPQPNHLDANASWNGFMYETYGPENDYVRSVLKEKPNNVWTVVVDNYFVVTEGYHHVNRQGYIITEIPFTPGDTYDVMDADDREEMENGGPPDDEDLEGDDPVDGPFDGSLEEACLNASINVEADKPGIVSPDDFTPG